MVGERKRKGDVEEGEGGEPQLPCCLSSWELEGVGRASEERKSSLAATYLLQPARKGGGGRAVQPVWWNVGLGMG